MINPVRPPGPGEAQPKPPSQPEPTKGKSFKDVAAEKERENWWSGYFTDAQFEKFKQTLVNFLSSQMKAQQQHLKDAMDRLKESESGQG